MTCILIMSYLLIFLLGLLLGYIRCLKKNTVLNDWLWEDWFKKLYLFWHRKAIERIKTELLSRSRQYCSSEIFDKDIGCHWTCDPESGEWQYWICLYYDMDCKLESKILADIDAADYRDFFRPANIMYDIEFTSQRENDEQTEEE